MEQRTLRTTSILTLHQKWAGLKQGFELKRQRTIKGQTTEEVVYGITSLDLQEANAKRLLELTRGHWGIENKLHWTMDVCFGEDQSRARTGNAAENLAALRRLALNLLKREKIKKRGIRGKMLAASWDHSYLLRLLGVQTKEN